MREDHEARCPQFLGPLGIGPHHGLGVEHSDRQAAPEFEADF